MNSAQTRSSPTFRQKQIPSSSMPMAAFFFVASKPIIELVLGSQWSGVAPIFSCLALAAYIQPASGFAGSLMLSLGQGQRYLLCGLFNAVILSLSFVIGVRWGPIGVAIAYAIGNYVVLYPWLWWAFSESPVSFRMFAGTCAFPSAISILSTCTSIIAGGLFQGFSSVVQIFLYAIVFVAVSAPLFFLTKTGKNYISIFYSLLKQFRNKSPITA